jgi:hypothetical protein
VIAWCSCSSIKEYPVCCNELCLQFLPDRISLMDDGLMATGECVTGGRMLPDGGDNKPRRRVRC